MEKTRYELICDGMNRFGSTLSDLSTAILAAMFDIISCLDKVRHAQYDLDDIGKQHGKSKSGNHIEVCEECFDFDTKTINTMMTEHLNRFSDRPRDDKENLNTPEASDDETEPFYADEDFEPPAQCTPLTTVNLNRRVKDLEETDFMTPRKAGPEGDGLPSGPPKSHGKGRTSKGGDRSGKDGTSKGDDSSGEDGTSKRDDRRDEDDTSERDDRRDEDDTSKRDDQRDEDDTLEPDDRSGDVPSEEASLLSGHSKRKYLIYQVLVKKRRKT